jgi:hypothetical protein
VGGAWAIWRGVEKWREGETFVGRNPAAYAARLAADARLALGIPLILLLTVPWFVWAIWQTDGEFFQTFFVYHNFDRGFGGEEGLRAYPWWFYGPHVLLGLLPWSLLLPIAGWWLWRNRDRDAQFGAVWFIAIFILLSCMRFKRADYLLPAFGGAAWMLGCVLERWYLAHPLRRWVVGFGSVIGLTGCLWIGYISVVLPTIDETRTHRLFAEEVRRRTSKEVVFFWTEAHLIAFHCGQPMTTSVDWKVLDNWAGRAEPSYIIMSPQALEEHRDHVKGGTLEILLWSNLLAPPLEQRPKWLQWIAGMGADVRERTYALVRTHRL